MMNSYTIVEKTQQIKRLTEYLLNKYGSTNIILTDYWDADLTAIGLTDKTRQYTVYISQYRQPKNSYFISLESPPTSEDSLSSYGEDFDNISEKEVEEILIKHLRIIECQQ